MFLFSLQINLLSVSAEEMLMQFADFDEVERQIQGELIESAIDQTM